MDSTFNQTTTAASFPNDTVPTGPTATVSGQRWEVLAAVLLSAVTVSVVTALLAKCQLVRRHLASYRHTRLREADNVSVCNQSGLEVEFEVQGGGVRNPYCLPPVSDHDHLGDHDHLHHDLGHHDLDHDLDDDDGFIEDNYIPASERARAERAAESMEVDPEEEQEEQEEQEMEEIDFSIP